MGLFGFGKKKLLISPSQVEAADRGDKNAENELMRAFENGLTTEEHNRLRRIAYSSKAVDGDAFAQYWMGFLCSMIDRNAEMAAYWYEQSAEQGNVKAMRDLYHGYSEFVNTENLAYGPVPLGLDLRKEEYWMEKAAKLGDAKAQYDLAFLMKIDKGNIEMAVYWYEKAANNQDFIYKIKSMEKLAEIYGNKEYAKFYSLKKHETLLLEIVCFKQRYMYEIIDGYDNIYRSALISLSVLYRNAYQKDGNKVMLKKAVYCLFLSYCQGADFVKPSLMELPYQISDAEMDAWSLQARRLEFDETI